MTLQAEGPRHPHPSIAALEDELRKHLPDVEPFALWRSHELTQSGTGRRLPVPLLVLTRGGLWLLHVDTHEGRLIGHRDHWRAMPLSGQPRTLEAPDARLATTAGLLREVLQRAASHGEIERVPPVRTAIVLVGGVVAEGTLQGRDDVFAVHDDKHEGLLRALLESPQDPSLLVRSLDRVPITDALQRAGLAPETDRLVQGYRLGELLEDHDVWQEHLATLDADPSKTARVRTWVLGRATSAEQLASLARAVRTESAVLAKIGHHPSILSLLATEDTGDRPPRLIFEDFDGEPLNRFLQANPDLSFEHRIDILLAVGEALAHCHRHEVRHRNLSPGSVLVKRDGPDVLVRLHRFESAMTAASAAGTRLGASAISAYADRMDDLYRAPEVFAAAESADETADLFSLGALALFVLSGKHAAPTLQARHTLIEQDEGLHLWRVIDNPDNALDALIAQATRWMPFERTWEDAELTVGRFLDVLRSMVRHDADEVAVDPLTATVGDRLDTSLGELTVVRVLGLGATSRVLQVEGPDGTAALKLPLEPRFEEVLNAEAHALTALAKVDHIVRLRGQPVMPTPDGRLTGLLLDFAGEQTLQDRVRAEGALSLDFCARLGSQLLAAVGGMHGHGIRHRDLKPANLAFSGSGHGAQQLVVFDFSLAGVPDAQHMVGTAGWRDPFLGHVRWSWDDEADLYGAAACLYYALTGERPQLATRGEHAGTVRVDAVRFDASVRGALTAFFERAFARDLADRHKDAEAMRDAWRTVFDDDTTTIVEPGLDGDGPPAPDLTELRRRARLDTPVGRLGLSARAVDGLERAGVFDVRDLLALPRNRLSGVRGVSGQTQRELQAAVRDLDALRHRPDVAAEPLVGTLHGLPRSLADAELPLSEAQLVVLEDAGLRTTHDLALHGRAAVLRLLELDAKGAKALADALRASAPAREVTGPLAEWVRTLLTPNPPSKRTKWEERVQMLTGLAPLPDEGPLGARTNVIAATACGDTQVVFRSAFQNARTWWSKHPEVAQQAVDAVLAALEGPAAPLRDVAARLVTTHLPTAGPDDDDALRQAAALVRFATEVDLPNAPLAWRLFGELPWVAPDAATLSALGRAAEALTLATPDEGLVTPEQAVAVLAPHLADTPVNTLPPHARLELVTRVAPDIALSSRAEVYRADLPAARAIHLAGPVLQVSALSAEDVHKRVRGRFPEGEPLPSRPALDLLLAPLNLQWSADLGRYLRPDTSLASLSRVPSTRLTTSPTNSPAEVEAARFGRDLTRELQAGGFRVLQVAARKAEEARRLLVHAFPELQVTSLDQAVYDALVARVQEVPGAQLDPLLALERDRMPPAHYAQLLQHFIRPALDRVVDLVLAARESRPQLLVHPGLLARYDARDALDRLVRTASSTGRGTVWLLLPALDDGGLPVIRHPDHVLPVPLSRPGQSLRVPHRWIAAASQTSELS